MKYIIDEIELKDLIKSLLDVPDEEDIKDIEDDFLKDKKPVEMIASGEVTKCKGYFGEWRALLNGFYYRIEHELLKRNGKNIEIYIKEV